MNISKYRIGTRQLDKSRWLVTTGTVIICNILQCLVTICNTWCSKCQWTWGANAHGACWPIALKRSMRKRWRCGTVKQRNIPSGNWSFKLIDTWKNWDSPFHSIRASNKDRKTFWRCFFKTVFSHIMSNRFPHVPSVWDVGSFRCRYPHFYRFPHVPSVWDVGSFRCRYPHF